MFFGGVGAAVKTQIKELTNFQEGEMPFRYLGVPMTSRRLEIHQYMPLIEKITTRITHWSSKLLSYAGKVQLVKSVCFATANYWIQCMPLPKQVIHHINAISRSFVWTGGDTLTRKSPVAWSNMCKSRKDGGLNIVNLQISSDIVMLKLLWNISNKKGDLWVKWVNCYYLKSQNVMQVDENQNQSWTFKGILRQRGKTMGMQQWGQMQHFNRCNIYKLLSGADVVVNWFRLFCGNIARPRSLFMLWLLCHEKMATRDRMARFGFIDHVQCSFCMEEETNDHIFFGCIETSRI